MKLLNMSKKLNLAPNLEIVILTLNQWKQWNVVANTLFSSPDSMAHAGQRFNFILEPDSKKNNLA